MFPMYLMFQKNFYLLFGCYTIYTYIPIYFFFLQFIIVVIVMIAVVATATYFDT